MTTAELIAVVKRQLCNHEWVYQPFEGGFGCTMSGNKSRYNHVSRCKKCGEIKIGVEWIELCKPKN